MLSLQIPRSHIPQKTQTLQTPLQQIQKIQKKEELLESNVPATAATAKLALSTANIKKNSKQLAASAANTVVKRRQNIHRNDKTTDIYRMGNRLLTREKRVQAK